MTALTFHWTCHLGCHSTWAAGSAEQAARALEAHAARPDHPHPQPDQQQRDERPQWARRRPQ